MAVLPRTSAIVRGSTGGTSEPRVLAANVDVVFVVHPIAQAPKPRRIERELSLAWESGAVPVVVLTKADLSVDVEVARQRVAEIAFDADVVTTNALAKDGVSPPLDFVRCHRTAVLIGPSGAGKSTLVNALLGRQPQQTREVRVADGRGPRMSTFGTWVAGSDRSWSAASECPFGPLAFDPIIPSRARLSSGPAASRAGPGRSLRA